MLDLHCWTPISGPSVPRLHCWTSMAKTLLQGLHCWDFVVTIPSCTWSRCHFVTLPHFHIASLSHCHMAKLLHCHIAGTPLQGCHGRTSIAGTSFLDQYCRAFIAGPHSRESTGGNSGFFMFGPASQRPHRWDITFGSPLPDPDWLTGTILLDFFAGTPLLGPHGWIFIASPPLPGLQLLPGLCCQIPIV
jgi:hypothetical protein